MRPPRRFAFAKCWVDLTAVAELAVHNKMKGEPNMPPQWGWKYILGAVGSWILFLASLYALLVGRKDGWPAAALIGLSLIPAATVALQFRAAYLRIASQDEFVRALTAKRMIFAAAVAITLATAWSMGELVGLPHLPAWLVYPLFWGMFGVATPLIHKTQA